jgi:IMP dehydrogenase
MNSNRRACVPFFEEMNRQRLALTYDDILLIPGHAELLPNQVKVGSMFSRNVPLMIPIVSAAMDSVTGSRLAIAMAMLGGLGVIPRHRPPKEQRDEIKRVKFALSGMIREPITVREDETIEAIENMRREKGYRFHSFLVTNSARRVTGLITRSEFRFCRDRSQTAADIMTTELITAEPGTTIEQAYATMCREKKTVLPLIGDDGEFQGMYLFNDVERTMTGSSAGYNLDSQGRLRVAAAIGVGDEALERVSYVVGFADVVVIDTAHADTDSVFATVKEIKKQFGDRIDVVAGNISDRGAAKRLADCGVDGIKVGQGPGSICTTRVVTGVGCPQATAVFNACEAIGADIPICADGGIKFSGDIPKAIGCGGHSVMIGSLLAGTTEAPGEVDFRFGDPVKLYRGMGSKSALEESRASRERYGQAEGYAGGKDALVPEGIEGSVPYSGDLKTVLDQLVGGLRNSMGYIGAANIEELRQKADFWRDTEAGKSESHPHGVKMLRDAPNYRRPE